MNVLYLFGTILDRNYLKWLDLDPTIDNQIIILLPRFTAVITFRQIFNDIATL